MFVAFQLSGYAIDNRWCAFQKMNIADVSVKTTESSSVSISYKTLQHRKKMNSVGVFFSLVLIPSGVLPFAATELETDQEMSFAFHAFFVCFLL